MIKKNVIIKNKKLKKNKMGNAYYILFLCSEYNDIKVNLVLTTFTEQITIFQAKNIIQNIEILVCKDNIESLTHMKTKC